MYAYLVTNLFSGRVEGTNDETKAKELSYAEEFFVVDVKMETQLIDGEGQAIPEMD